MAVSISTEEHKLPASLDDFAKTVELNPSYWADLPADLRTQFRERLFWLCIQKINPMPTPKEVVLQELSGRPWYLDNPQILNNHEPAYLCETCRHIDFEYLIDSPIDQMQEEIPLATLKWIFEHDMCSFCHLISSTIRSTMGKQPVFTEVGGKDIVCTARTLPMDIGPSGPREIWISIAGGVLDASDMHFSRFNPANDLDRAVRGHSARSPRINYSLVKRWHSDCLNGKCGFASLPSRPRDLPKGFRVIDVQRYCIVDAEPDCEYVALS